MGNPKASSVAPLTPLESPGSIQDASAQATEQPRDFHFAVTWVTLFAHLDLVPANGPWRRCETPSPTLALVPVVASPLIIEPPAHHDSNAAWEMVVPKMIRTGSGDFTPVKSSEADS
jgi:hypothetical protein